MPMLRVDHTEQQQVHKIKSKCSAFGKKDDVSQVEKIHACSENRVSEKALLQFICLDQEHGSRVQTKFGTYKLQYILNVYSYKAVPWRKQ